MYKQKHLSSCYLKTGPHTDTHTHRNGPQWSLLKSSSSRTGELGTRTISCGLQRPRSAGLGPATRCRCKHRVRRAASGSRMLLRHATRPEPATRRDQKQRRDETRRRDRHVPARTPRSLSHERSCHEHTVSLGRWSRPPPLSPQAGGASSPGHSPPHWLDPSCDSLAVSHWTGPW